MSILKHTFPKVVNKSVKKTFRQSRLRKYRVVWRKVKIKIGKKFLCNWSALYYSHSGPQLVTPDNAPAVDQIVRDGRSAAN